MGSVLFKHQATIANFLAQRIRESKAKKKSPAEEEDERTSQNGGKNFVITLSLTYAKCICTQTLSTAVVRASLASKTCLFLNCASPRYPCGARGQRVVSQEASVHETSRVVLEYRWLLSHSAQRPTAALGPDGTNVLQRLRGIFACRSGGCTTRRNIRPFGVFVL